MFCGNCGKEIDEGTKFCTKCGWSIPEAHVTIEKPEELRCSACGTVIKKGTEFCGNCGNKISAYGVYSNRKRHGFTSFWLISGIIICSITGLYYLFLPNLLDELYIFLPLGLIIITGIAMLVQVAGLVLLLRWKKIGFWIIIGVFGVCSLTSLVSLASGGSALQILGGIIGTAVYWGVLQLKKDGKTTWELLE